MGELLLLVLVIILDIPDTSLLSYSAIGCTAHDVVCSKINGISHFRIGLQSKADPNKPDKSAMAIQRTALLLHLWSNKLLSQLRMQRSSLA